MPSRRARSSTRYSSATRRVAGAFGDCAWRASDACAPFASPSPQQHAHLFGQQLRDRPARSAALRSASRARSSRCLTPHPARCRADAAHRRTRRSPALRGSPARARRCPAPPAPTTRAMRIPRRAARRALQQAASGFSRVSEACKSARRTRSARRTSPARRRAASARSCSNRAATGAQAYRHARLGIGQRTLAARSSRHGRRRKPPLPSFGPATPVVVSTFSGGAPCAAIWSANGAKRASIGAASGSARSSMPALDTRGSRCTRSCDIAIRLKPVARAKSARNSVRCQQLCPCWASAAQRSSSQARAADHLRRIARVHAPLAVGELEPRRPGQQREGRVPARSPSRRRALREQRARQLRSCLAAASTSAYAIPGSASDARVRVEHAPRAVRARPLTRAGRCALRSPCARWDASCRTCAGRSRPARRKSIRLPLRYRA